ncbi:MAG TPA: hypothetical protein PLX23_11860 [Candidatus Hydrogenedens sp.]|nr:hypothetical protein [Candidatus Hydrogenedens sp.]
MSHASPSSNIRIISSPSFSRSPGWSIGYQRISLGSPVTSNNAFAAGGGTTVSWSPFINNTGVGDVFLA